MNWKKAMLAGTLAVTTAALVAGCGGQDKKAADQKMPDKIVIGLDDNFPPMGFRNEGGELVGFDIDLAKEAAKRNSNPSTGTAKKPLCRVNRWIFSGTG